MNKILAVVVLMFLAGGYAAYLGWHDEHRQKTRRIDLVFAGDTFATASACSVERDPIDPWRIHITLSQPIDFLGAVGSVVTVTGVSFEGFAGADADAIGRNAKSYLAQVSVKNGDLVGSPLPVTYQRTVPRVFPDAVKSFDLKVPAGQISADGTLDAYLQKFFAKGLVWRMETEGHDPKQKRKKPVRSETLSSAESADPLRAVSSCGAALK